MQENVLLTEGGVLVSSARFVTPTATYATAQISSVRTASVAASKTGPGCMVAFGVLALLGALAAMVEDGAAGVCGLIFGGVLSVYGLRQYRAATPTYYLFVRTTAGEVPALSHRDWETIARVSDALNRAIIARG